MLIIMLLLLIINEGKKVKLITLEEVTNIVDCDIEDNGNNISLRWN